MLCAGDRDHASVDQGTSTPQKEEVTNSRGSCVVGTRLWVVGTRSWVVGAKSVVLLVP